METILVTGSQGFIGSHYFEYVKNHYTTIGADIQFTGWTDYGIGEIDLKDKDRVKDLPDCDVVFHLAATNGTRLFYENPTDVLINNTTPTINLIERYRNSKTKFVFASTCEIFNGAIDAGYYTIPTDEQVPVMFKDIQNPRWSYSIPKALGENLVANSGLEYLIIRYFNIYGPRQKDHFISEFVERCQKGEYYIKGNDTRSFCFIDDAIEMTHRLIKHASNQIVHVGRSKETKIETVAKAIMDVMGIDPDKLEIQPGPVGSAKRRCPDTTLVKELTGFEHYTDIYNGLKKTVESLI
jgi:nucleoside-diphosphate-sugar epimerase|tara:strand:- start:10835 stop:11722 length:888 start_codon:yes stop_codon:yes gene_type:complete